MKIIVGSKALQHFNLNRNTPNDIDYWLSEDEIIEHSTDSHITPRHILNLVPTEDGYATPDAVYTIKMSHAVYPIKWPKTKLDILHLKWNGCKIIPELYEALKVHWIGV